MTQQIDAGLAELAEELAKNRLTEGSCLTRTFKGQDYCPMLRAPEPDFACSEADDDYVSVPEPTENNPFNTNRYRICRFRGR